MSETAAEENPVDEFGAAELSGLSVHTIRKLRRQGGGPKFLKLAEGRRGAVRYYPSDVRTWLGAKRVDSTSAMP